MKKMKTLLTIILLSSLCLFSGCKKGWFADEHEFLYEKMSEIPIEYEGYCLKACLWNDEMCITKGQHIPSYEYVFRDGAIFVQRTGDGRTYTISYNDFEVVIDQSFMEEKNLTYASINQIWVGKPMRCLLRELLESVFMMKKYLL